MAAWPAILPQGFLRGFTVKLRDSVLRTSMDVGPDKVRRRVTYTAADATGQIICTEAQVLALEHFYMSTTANGTVRFSMKAPHHGQPRDARFLEPPEVSWLGGNVFQCTLKLELFDTAVFADNAIWPSGDNWVWPDGQNAVWPDLPGNWG